jgi:hypothetical protein
MVGKVRPVAAEDSTPKLVDGTIFDGPPSVSPGRLAISGESIAFPKSMMTDSGLLSVADKVSLEGPWTRLVLIRPLLSEALY